VALGILRFGPANFFKGRNKNCNRLPFTYTFVNHRRLDFDAASTEAKEFMELAGSWVHRV